MDNDESLQLILKRIPNISYRILLHFPKISPWIHIPRPPTVPLSFYSMITVEGVYLINSLRPDGKLITCGNAI